MAAQGSDYLPGQVAIAPTVIRPGRRGQPAGLGSDQEIGRLGSGWLGTWLGRRARLSALGLFSGWLAVVLLRSTLNARGREGAGVIDPRHRSSEKPELVRVVDRGGESGPFRAGWPQRYWAGRLLARRVKRCDRLERFNNPMRAARTVPCEALHRRPPARESARAFPCLFERVAGAVTTQAAAGRGFLSFDPGPPFDEAINNDCFRSIMRAAYPP